MVNKSEAQGCLLLVLITIFLPMLLVLLGFDFGGDSCTGGRFGDC